MTFLSPVWLLLLIPVLAITLLWRPPGRLLTALRIAALIALALALAGLAWWKHQPAGTVVVLADRSTSMPEAAAQEQATAIKLLRNAKAPDHRLAVISFARQAGIERAGDDKTAFEKFQLDVGTDQSHLADAIDRGLSIIGDDESARLLVLSDGRWTGRDPVAAATRAAGRDIPIDHRVQQRSIVNDIGIETIDAPHTVVPGESFLSTIWVRSPASATVSYRLRRGGAEGTEVSTGTRQLVAGLNQFVFRDQAGDPGVLAYRFEVTEKPVPGITPDPMAENNTGRFLVGVKGPLPILHCSVGDSSGLNDLLKASKLPVVHKKAEETDFNFETLSQHSAVILENVPARHLDNDEVGNLAAWVEFGGGGLMTTGGRNAYGIGGWYRSPLEDVLPVTMELRREHRKLRLGIVVVLDRSGSMSAGVAGGKTKMDLANIGTAEVYDLLGPEDEIGVIAVDSAPHTVVKLQRKGGGGAKRKILSIESMGGGIYVYSGLVAAAKMLDKASSGTRHIILFADAADAEEPGKYKALLKKCETEGITVSVIGLGTDKDSDAAFLKDVAKRGNGQVYFTQDPKRLPQLFAQDTFTVARSTFVQDNTAFGWAAGWPQLNDTLRSQPPELGGYNLCYMRPEATISAMTRDEFRAPVIASWNVGSGRALSFTGEADGEFAGPLGKWDKVGTLFNSLARWTAGDYRRLPPNMLLDTRLEKGALHIDLHLDPRRKTETFAALPSVDLLRGRPGRQPFIDKASLSWREADRLSLRVPLGGDETVVPNVTVPGFDPVALSPVRLPYSEEFRPVQEGKGAEALQRISKLSGGGRVIDLGSIWNDLPPSLRLISLRPWLILFALSLFFLEVLERRTGLLTNLPGLRSIDFDRVEARRKAHKPKTKAAPPPKMTKPKKTKKAKDEVAKDAIPKEVRSSTLSALKEARDKAKDRMGE